MSALEDCHEHRVHDAQDTDNNSEEGGDPAHGPDNAKSFTVAEVFAHCHGPDLGNELLDLLTEFAQLLLSRQDGRRPAAD